MSTTVNVYELGINPDCFDISYLGNFDDTRLIHEDIEGLEFVKRDGDEKDYLEEFYQDLPFLQGCLSPVENLEEFELDEELWLAKVDCKKALANVEELMATDSAKVLASLHPKAETHNGRSAEEDIEEVEKIQRLINSLESFNPHPRRSGIYVSENGIDVRFNFQSIRWLLQQMIETEEDMFISLKHVVEATF